MIVHIFDRTKPNTLDREGLLSLFRNATTESDYMAMDEIRDLETLDAVLNKQNLIHFFGYDENIPIAYCQVIHKSGSVHFKSGAKINALSVLPEWRGKGLGRKLLEKVIATLAKNHVIKNIYLEVVKDNVTAVNLYKGVGFKKTGELESLFTKNDTLLDIEIYSLLINQ